MIPWGLIKEKLMSNSNYDTSQVLVSICQKLRKNHFLQIIPVTLSHQFLFVIEKTGTH